MSDTASRAFGVFGADGRVCSQTTELPFHRSGAPRPFAVSPSHRPKAFSSTRHVLPKVQLTPLDLGGFGPLASRAHLSEQLQMTNGPGRGEGPLQSEGPPGKAVARDLSLQARGEATALSSCKADWLVWLGPGREGTGACKASCWGNS